jgi:tRNA 2-thiocytidine biosynthesis protein TtcA
MSLSSSLELKLFTKMQHTIGHFSLIEKGDRVMVCLSGGKDSWTLLHLLEIFSHKTKNKFEFVAVHLDQQQPGYDGSALTAFLKNKKVPFEILSEDTYSIVKATTAPGETYCAKCSRLRRGILYSAAQRLGCNSIALGHHREDTLETFLLNLIYTGKMQAMPAGYTTDDGKLRVIRPLIECAESDIAQVASDLQFPILPCNLCGSQAGLKRDTMNQLLNHLESLHPKVRESMMGALSNIRPTHLLDVDVTAQWNAREKVDAVKASPIPPRFNALPIVSTVDEWLMHP